MQATTVVALIVGALVVIAITIATTVNMREERIKDERQYHLCIERGGSYVHTESGSVCIRG